MSDKKYILGVDLGGTSINVGVVPYEGGWQVNEDVNGGKWVSGTLPPDRPPSVEYETWPGTYLPPFHFPNPVIGTALAGGDFEARPTRATLGRSGRVRQTLLPFPRATVLNCQPVVPA